MVTFATARANIVAQIVDGAANSITPSKHRQLLLDVVDALNDSSARFPQLGYNFDTNTTSGAGSGEMRLNNGDKASATELYLNETSSLQGNVADFLAIWDDSTKSGDKGFIYIYDPSDASNWAIYQLTGTQTDNGDDRTFPITHIGSAGSLWLDSVPLHISWTRSADASGFVPSPGDYSASEVSNDSGVSGANVDDALNQLDTDIAGKANSSHNHSASDINSGTLAHERGGLEADVSAYSGLVKISGGATSAVPETSASDYRSDTGSGVLKNDEVWDALAEVTLTDAASITFDMGNGIDFKVTLGGNRTLANPTNTTPGKKGAIRVIQDGTGSRTLSFGSNFEFAAKTAPTLTTGASEEDMLYYHCISSTRIVISPLLEIG